MSMQRAAVSESAFRGRGATAWGRAVLFAAIVALVAGLLPTPAVQPAAAATSRRADAAVLVNSASPGFADYTHYVKPYLDHFGFAYTTLDIATVAIASTIGAYAVIVVGHRGLDTADAYLDATEEGFLSNAVSSGAGLVNFDNDLSAGGVGRYAFVNDVFGFGYAGATSGSGLVFPATGHYITAQHAAGSSLGTGGMTLGGITLPATGYTAVATTSAGAPVVAAGTYGGGRAVQFNSYDWMRIGVLGPMYGADDLVWRSIVWAARKPFVMQGLPPFVTMRVDDESGPFNWMHVANEFGIKPWAGLFYHNVDDAEAADLSGLTNAKNATVSIHAKNGSFFYFNHGSGSYDDATVAANFAEGTAWHAARNIPISKYVLPHYYEFGTNVFEGLADWGVEFVGTQMEPGNGYGAPWIMNGPFRTFETGGSGGGVPQYYADFMTAPGQSALDDKFFNCVTEIRDDGGYEWYPNPVGDLSGTIARGTRHLERVVRRDGAGNPVHPRLLHPSRCGRDDRLARNTPGDHGQHRGVSADPRDDGLRVPVRARDEDGGHRLGHVRSAHEAAQHALHRRRRHSHEVLRVHRRQRPVHGRRARVHHVRRHDLHAARPARSRHGQPVVPERGGWRDAAVHRDGL